MNISIVIPNFNGEQLLKQNLPKVLEASNNYTRGTVEVVVVDDASTDGSWGFLYTFSDQNKNVHVLKNDKNYGFSTTVNRGVAKTMGEIVILLNTDVVPESGFLNKVVPHFTAKELFAVGFMDKSIENDTTVLRGRGVIRWYRGFILHDWGDINKTETFWVSGGSGAFRKNIWNKFGGFNELYNPFYWEDIDLSYRAIKRGYQICFDKEITTIHEHERGAIKVNNDASRIQMIAYRNQFLFFWLNITDKKLWLKHFLWLPIHFINALRDMNKAFFQGFMQACGEISRIKAYRQKNDSTLVVADSKILSQFQS